MKVTKKVTKKVAIVLILSLVLSTITACGNASAKKDGVRTNSDDTVSEIGDSDDNEDSDDAEDDEESDNSVDETASDSSESENLGNDFTEDGNNSSSEESGNANEMKIDPTTEQVGSGPSKYISDESFWKSEDEFDFKGYAKANNLTLFMSDNSGIANVLIYHNDWRIDSDGQSINFLSNSGTTASYYEAVYRIVSAQDENVPKIVVYKNSKLDKDSLDCFILLVKAIIEHDDAEDPLSFYPDSFYLMSAREDGVTGATYTTFKDD